MTFTAVTDFTTEVVLHQIGLMPDACPEGFTNGCKHIHGQVELMATNDRQARTAFGSIREPPRSG